MQPGDIVKKYIITHYIAGCVIIKFSTLEQSVSEIGVILRIFSLISNVFMKIYEYSK